MPERRSRGCLCLQGLHQGMMGAKLSMYRAGSSLRCILGRHVVHKRPQTYNRADTCVLCLVSAFGALLHLQVWRLYNCNAHLSSPDFSLPIADAECSSPCECTSSEGRHFDQGVCLTRVSFQGTFSAVLITSMPGTGLCLCVFKLTCLLFCMVAQRSVLKTIQLEVSEYSSTGRNCHIGDNSESKHALRLSIHSFDSRVYYYC